MSIREKIRAQSEKTGHGVARARKEGAVSAALTKIVRKAAQIADLMTGEDVEEDLRVLREAKHATHRIFVKEEGGLMEVPDHKTRLAATTLSRAYHEGKPIERSVSVIGDFKDLADDLRDLRSSPEATRMLRSLGVGELPEAQETSPL